MPKFLKTTFHRNNRKIIFAQLKRKHKKYGYEIT